MKSLLLILSATCASTSPTIQQLQTTQARINLEEQAYCYPKASKSRDDMLAGRYDHFGLKDMPTLVYPFCLHAKELGNRLGMWFGQHFSLPTKPSVTHELEVTCFYPTNPLLTPIHFFLYNFIPQYRQLLCRSDMRGCCRAALCRRSQDLRPSRQPQQRHWSGRRSLADQHAAAPAWA